MYPQFQQQQQGLPYDPLNQQITTVSLQNGHVPFVPQVTCSPRAAQLVPEITFRLIDEIQQKMGTNPLRMFMFNRYAQNGYQNNDFVSAVSLAVNWVDYSLQMGHMPNADAAVGNAVPQVAKMFASDAINEFQGLLGAPCLAADGHTWITVGQNQGLMNSAQQSIQQLAQMVQVLGQMRQQMQGGFQSGYQQGFQGQQRQGLSAMGGFQNQPPQFQGHQGYQAPVMGMSSTPSGMYNYGQQTQAAAPVSTVTGNGNAWKGNDRLAAKSQQLMQSQQRGAIITDTNGWNPNQPLAQQVSPANQTAQGAQNNYHNPNSGVASWGRSRFSNPAPAPAPVAASAPQTRDSILTMPIQPRVMNRANNGYNPEGILGSSKLPEDLTASAQAPGAASVPVRSAIPLAANNPRAAFGGNVVDGQRDREVVMNRGLDPQFIPEAIFNYYAYDQLPEQCRWLPTMEQPAQPAWNPYTQKPIWVVNVHTNQAILAVQELSESERLSMESMNQADHVINPQRLRPLVPEAKVVTVEEIRDHHEVPVTVKVNTSDKYSMEIHEEAGALSIQVEAVLRGELQAPESAVRRMLIVAEPLAFKHNDEVDDAHATIEAISNAGSFNAAILELKSLTSPANRQFFKRLDAILTEEVNRALSVNLSLDLDISSFFEDASNLYDYIKDHYDVSIADALRVKEAEILRLAITTLPAGESESFTETLYDQSDDGTDEGAAEVQAQPTEASADAAASTETAEPKPVAPKVRGHLAFIASQVTYTFLGSYFEELGLALPDAGVGLLLQSHNPNLYQVAVDMFKDQRIKNSTFRRHYFVTKDGVKFEITRGYLNRESFIIGLAK